MVIDSLIELGKQASVPERLLRLLTNMAKCAAADLRTFGTGVFSPTVLFVPIDPSDPPRAFTLRSDAEPDDVHACVQEHWREREAVIAALTAEPLMGPPRSRSRWPSRARHVTSARRSSAVGASSAKFEPAPLPNLAWPADDSGAARTAAEIAQPSSGRENPGDSPPCAWRSGA